MTASAGGPGSSSRSTSDGTAGLRAHRSHEVIDIGDCLIAHAGIRDLGIPRRHWDGATAVETAVGDSGREAVVVLADPQGRHPAANATPLRDGGTPAPVERGPRARFAQEKPEGVQTVAAESILIRKRAAAQPPSGAVPTSPSTRRAGNGG